MSRFVLGEDDMQRTPILISFAYGRQSMAGIHRRWADIILLGKVNLWLVFACNVLALLLILFGIIVMPLTSGVKDIKTDLFVVALMAIAARLAPDLLRLLNMMRGVGYTKETQHKLAEQIAEDAMTNKELKS